MRALAASISIVTAWHAKWEAIGGGVALGLAGEVVPWRLAPDGDDKDDREEAQLRLEFEATPGLARGLRAIMRQNALFRRSQMLADPAASLDWKIAADVVRCFAIKEKVRKRRRKSEPHIDAVENAPLSARSA